MYTHIYTHTYIHIRAERSLLPCNRYKYRANKLQGYRLVLYIMNCACINLVSILIFMQTKLFVIPIIWLRRNLLVALDQSIPRVKRASHPKLPCFRLRSLRERLVPQIKHLFLGPLLDCWSVRPF